MLVTSTSGITSSCRCRYQGRLRETNKYLGDLADSGWCVPEIEGDFPGYSPRRGRLTNSRLRTVLHHTIDQRWAKCGSRATCGSPTFRLRLFISTPVPYSSPSYESYWTSCVKLTQIHERVIKSFRNIIPYCTVLTPCV